MQRHWRTYSLRFSQLSLHCMHMRATFNYCMHMHMKMHHLQIMLGRCDLWGKYRDHGRFRMVMDGLNRNGDETVTETFQKLKNHCIKMKNVYIYSSRTSFPFAFWLYWSFLLKIPLITMLLININNMLVSTGMSSSTNSLVRVKFLSWLL